MKQLNLFERKPSLECGKAYRMFYGYKNEHFKDVYVASVKLDGDSWNEHCPIVYFVITPNTLKGMEHSIHDCGYYIHEWYKLEVCYKTPCNEFYELKYSDLIQFVSKLRDKEIRSRFGLSRHPNWDSFY